MKLKTIVLVASAVLLGVSAQAYVIDGIDYSVWKEDGSGSWADATRWVGGNVPTSGSKSVLITNDSPFATDADYSVLSGLVRLRFRGKSSLDLRFDEDHDFALNTIMNMSSSDSGMLIKSGTGRLVHTGFGNGFDLKRFIVTNGVLEVRATRSNVSYGVYGDDALLAFNGKNDKNNDSELYIGGFEGDGLVTNMTSKFIYCCGGTAAKPMSFSGRLAKGTEPAFNSSGYHDFLGNFTGSLTIRIYDGSVGLKDFGMIGGGGSLGNGNFWFQGNSELRYLGTGETTDRKMNLGDGCRSFAVDGGAGGLTLSGEWSFLKGPNLLPITLKGTNVANACVFSGTYSGASTNGFNLMKKGTGIWRLEGSRSQPGTVSVDEGTLEYASISERGANSSIGAGSLLAEPVLKNKASATAVPWAVRLGTHSTTGKFVYAGSSSYVSCTSRLFAVRGGGLVGSKNGTSLRFKGATSYDAEGGNLILDGSGEYNSFTDVTNGVGALSVTKTGAGTWNLCGDLALSGGVDVREGTLHICNATNFTWFKYTVKEIYKPNEQYLQIAQFGLYDEQGDQQNLNLDEVSLAGSTYMLETGRAAWNHTVTLLKQERVLSSLFTGADGLITTGRSSLKNIEQSTPSSWMSFTMRLANGINPVKYYDVKSQQGFKSGAMYGREPKVWMLEGSVDGRNWVFIDERSGLTVSQGGACWYSCDQADHDETHRGFDISSVVPSSSVSIASLRVSGGGVVVADAPLAVSNLVVDATSGGTLDGFAFAERGTLTVKNLPAGKGMTELPGTYLNCTGLDGVSRWTLSLDGEPTRKRISASGGVLRIYSPGTTVIFR